MKHYRIECTGDRDQLVSMHDFACADDLAALEKATALCKHFGVEVWDGDRRIVWLHKGGEARLDMSRAREIREAMEPPDSKSVRDEVIAEQRAARAKRINCGASP